MAFTRAKIKYRSILVKVLIDSGNLVGDIISDQLAKVLQLTIKGPSATCGTANKAARAEILGYVDPFLIYIEGIAVPCILYPKVMKGLAHPVNLGEMFLKRNSAAIAFKPSQVALTIRNDTIHLGSASKSLLSPSTDSRIKPVLDQYRYNGENPKVDPQVELLVVRNRSPLPGLNNRPVKGTFQVGAPESTPVRVPRPITIPARTSMKVPVDLQVPPAGQDGIEVMFIPDVIHPCISKDVMPMAGIYTMSQCHRFVTISNFNNKSVKINPEYPIGYVNAVELQQSEEVSELSHKAAADLTDAELKERTEFIQKSLKLHEKPMLQGHPDIIKQTVQLFLDNFDAVSIGEDDYGKTDLVQFKIELKEGAIPHKAKDRPLNPIYEKSLEKQLDQWLHAKVIEPANSPWSAALVPVKKKDSTDIRWAIDFRALNEVTVNDCFPLPRIDTTLNKLQGSCVYSSLDSAGAFHAIEVSPESRPMTAFSTPFGQYSFLRLPFGVKNGPSCYSRLIQRALGHLPQTFALAYIDDIIVYSKSVRDHFEHLKIVIEIHTTAGMKLKLRKCHLFMDKCNYLGYQVSANGLDMIPEYVQNIVNWPRPQYGKDLKSFLGFCSYYRSFIINYALYTKDLEKMKMKDSVEWTKVAEEAFEALKKAFTEAPTRGYPDYDSPEKFILDTDWSADAVAGVLSQVQNGCEKFLGCVARKCNTYERNYPAYKGELCAVIFAMTKFEHMLLAKPFILRTDSSPLQYLKTAKKNSGIFARWHQYLASFEFEVWHRPGKKHVTADSLSRRKDIPAEEPENPDKLPPEDPIDTAHDPVYAVEEWHKEAASSSVTSLCHSSTAYGSD